MSNAERRPAPLIESDPHRDCPVLSAGVAVEKADTVLLLLHGRGAGAESILALFPVLGVERVAAFAPQAFGRTWYPHSFLAPLELNQPYLDSALLRLTALIEDLITRGTAYERIALLGFSQGACLALEFAARNARRYAAVIGLSGGLIGPSGTARNYQGSLDGTPVLLGSADPDPHVPFERVVESQKVLMGMGAVVQLERYPGAPHAINEDELQICRSMLKPAKDALRA